MKRTLIIIGIGLAVAIALGILIFLSVKSHTQATPDTEHIIENYLAIKGEFECTI